MDMPPSLRQRSFNFPVRMRKVVRTARDSRARGMTRMAAVSSLNAADYGLTANSGRDETRRLQAAIDDAQRKQVPLFIPAGSYHIGTVSIAAPLVMSSHAGGAILFGTANQGPCLRIAPTGRSFGQVRLSEITLDGRDAPAVQGRLGLIEASQVSNLTIERCILRGSKSSGIALHQARGWIRDNVVEGAAETAIVSRDGTVTIEGNVVNDSGNQGIQVVGSTIGDDGSIVANNRITNTTANRGGSGAYGNAISLYRAGKVAVTGNKISSSAFSAIRANSASDVQIIGNETTSNGECAIYVEAPDANDTYNGAVIANNIVRDTGSAINVVNQDYGGRRAVISGNQIIGSTNKPVVDGSYSYQTWGTGITACADVVVSDNIIENCESWGVILDPTNYARAPGAFIAQASNNQLKNCAGGILFCRNDATAYVAIGGNTIYRISSDPKFGAVVPGRYLGTNQNYGRLGDATDYANSTVARPFPNVMLGQNFGF
jgi:uncharacterized secreted repeat protein (TIGR03808 family)